MNPNFILPLLSLLLILKHSLSTNYTLSDLTHLKIIPYADLKQTINFSDNTTTLKAQSFGNYFYRLDSNRVIKVWDTSNPTTATLICTVSSVAQIKDFAIDVWNGEFAYVDSNKTITIVYPNCTVNGSFQVNYSTVNAQVFFSFTYVGLWFNTRNYTDRQSKYSFRYWRYNFTFIKGEQFWEFNGSTIRLAHCVKPFAPYNISEFFMVYDNKSHVRLYGWWDNAGTLAFNHNPSTAPLPNNYTWSIKSVKFDFDCGNIYLTYGTPINKVTILYHDQTRFLNHLQFPSDVQIHTAVPVDQKKWIMAVFLTNDSVVFYNVTATTKNNIIWNVQPMPYLFQKNLTAVSNQDPFSRSTSLFYVDTNTKTQVFRLECPSGIRLGMGLCLDTFDEAVQQNFKFQQLRFIFKAMKVMAFVIAFMQMTPLAGVFLRFINFWNICSIYSLVEVTTVQPLASILYEIYMVINAQLLDMMGIDFSLSITREQKVTGKYVSEYKISSNFMGIIFEPVVCTLVMCMVFYAFELIRRRLFSEGRKRRMGVSKFRVFFGQYVSFLSIFMFPLKFILLSLYRQKYEEKWNSALNVIFICSGLVSPFAMILLNEKRQLEKNGDKNVRAQDVNGKDQVVGMKERLKKMSELGKIKRVRGSCINFENMEFVYVCLVNISMPILGTMPNPLWFIIICGLLILIGIIVDFKRSSWRINSIIMTLQLIVFHLCFSLHFIDLSQKNKYLLSVICTLIIMLGAIHQILTLIATVCMNVHLIFFFNKNKVADQKAYNLQIQKKPTKSSLKCSKKVTNNAKQTNHLDKQPRKDKQIHPDFDKDKSKVGGKFLRQTIIKQRVKVEQMPPESAIYDEIENNEKLNKRQMQLKQKIVVKKANKKQFNIQNESDKIQTTRQESAKKATFYPKLKFKPKTSRKINQMILNIKHE